jgi:hypothetical protein
MQVEQPLAQVAPFPFKATGPSSIFLQALRIDAHVRPISVSPTFSAMPSPPAFHHHWTEGSLAARQAMMYFISPPSSLHQASSQSTPMSPMDDSSCSMDSDFVRQDGDVSGKCDVPAYVSIPRLEKL